MQNSDSKTQTSAIQRTSRARTTREETPLAYQTPVTQDARFEAVRRRDGNQDGVFFYAVRSTGVYCRPSCGARLPLRKNVEFHDSAEAAERAGFRACKRCQPDKPALAQRQRELLARVCSQLESVDAPKTLAALAEGVGLSPFYLQRLFKQHMGMTPRAYAAAHRLRKLRRGLREGHSVTAALYEAGYSSSSRFYERDSRTLGLTPQSLRTGGRGLSLRLAVRPCSLGQMLVASSERGVCAITFGDQEQELRAALAARFPHAVLLESDAEHDDLTAQLVVMVDDASFSREVSLDLIGTAFQQRVWRALQDIPRGATCTYAELAERIGAPLAVRAVGTACGQNPVAALVPCHRVLRRDGSLGGYRWGLTRKQQLLDVERRIDSPAREP